MDRVYVHQRYVYDVTRKFFLLGRDILLREMNIGTGDHVLEIGCGTCRNIVILAEKYPDAYFYGLDASWEMLKTAKVKIERKKINGRIRLTHGLAENLDPVTMFNRSEPFDIIFYSYSLTMIPGWKESLQKAYGCLKTGGYLYAVDFWDQEKFPSWFRKLLATWLRFFYVKHDPEMVPFLSELAVQRGHIINIESLYGRYAFKICIKK